MTWRLCILSTVPGQWLAQRSGHPCLEDEWANIMSRVRAIQDQSWPCMGLNHLLITGLPGSQVGAWIPLTSSSSIVSVPVQNTGKVMESSKEPGHFGQFTWQNVLRTVTTDQRWGISLSDSRVRMRARALEEPALPPGESPEMSPAASPGHQAGAAGRLLGPGAHRRDTNLCPRLEPVWGLRLAKHVSSLLWCTSVSLNESS